MKCPDCNGIGIVKTIVDADSTNRHEEDAKCDQCDGEGEICADCEYPESECICYGDEDDDWSDDWDEDEDEDWEDEDDSDLDETVG